jgi:hypothetical protein
VLLFLLGSHFSSQSQGHNINSGSVFFAYHFFHTLEFAWRGRASLRALERCAVVSGRLWRGNKRSTCDATWSGIVVNFCRIDVKIFVATDVAFKVAVPIFIKGKAVGVVAKSVAPERVGAGSASKQNSMSKKLVKLAFGTDKLFDLSLKEVNTGLELFFCRSEGHFAFLTE